MIVLVRDRLKGVPKVVANVWSETIVQKCLVHLRRYTYRLTSKRDWDALKKHVTPFYAAVHAAAPRTALAEFVGTAFLVAAVTGSGIGAVRLSPHDSGLQLLENSIITGAALVALTWHFRSCQRRSTRS